MAGLPATLLAIALLLVLVSATQPVARRLMLPETVLLAGLGIVLGGSANLLLQSPNIHALDTAARVIANFPLDSEGVLTIFLPILVFAGSLTIDVRRLARDGTTVLVLAIVAVVISTAAIGYAVYPFAGLPIASCLMLGAIVANTDPSAVTAIFGEVGAASRLTRLVEGEALLNDAAAISVFGLLLDAITQHRAFVLQDAALSFTISFFGALVVGVLFARAALAMIAIVAESTAGEVTLSLALPFITYIVCEHFLHLSGVVGVAAAGLTLSNRGQSMMQQRSWALLTEIWEQLAFWAGSLVFVLASMLVPRLLGGIDLHDIALIALALVAAMAARAAVLFVLLPLLARAGWARPVPRRYGVTIWWGGLRGAITLALALSVTENLSLSAATQHFVAVVATGFTLFTLLVNGTTLRPLVLLLGLDRLSARDEALRRQVLAIGLGEIRDRTRDLATDLGFREEVSAGVLGELEERVAREQDANDFDDAIGDNDRIALALITLAARERTLLVEQFQNRGLSRRVVAQLVRTADAMIDGARFEGRAGFVRAARRRLPRDARFRLAEFLHLHFRIDGPMMRRMTERYEVALISVFLGRSLDRFMRRRIGPVLGARVAEIVSEVLERRQRLLGEALDSMRLHYTLYSGALESRILSIASLRLENEEFDDLAAENLIGEELHSELIRSVERRRRRLSRPLRFDLQTGIDQRIKSFALLAGVHDARLHELSGRIAIRFMTPGQRLVSRGAHPNAVYLVSSGRLEQRIGDRDHEFVAGEQAGAVEILEGQRMGSGIRCLTVAHLLVVPRREFLQLVEDHPVVRRNAEAGDAARLARAGIDAIEADPPRIAEETRPAIPAPVASAT